MRSDGYCRVARGIENHAHGSHSSFVVLFRHHKGIVGEQNVSDPDARIIHVLMVGA